MATLKELTWEFHKNAERSSFARKLLKGQLSVEEYGEYLYNQHYQYRILETLAEKAGLLNGIEGICRAEAIQKDINELNQGNYNASTTAENYVKHLYELYKNSPEQLMAHIYVRHFGDLHGGQMIARKVPGSGEYYKFNDAEGLITEVRSRLAGKEDEYVDEAIKCFQYATDLFKELDVE